MRKLVKKHGQEAVAGIVTTALSAAAAKFANDSDGDGKKSKKGKKRKGAAESQYAYK